MTQAGIFVSQAAAKIDAECRGAPVFITLLLTISAASQTHIPTTALAHESLTVKKVAGELKMK